MLKMPLNSNYLDKRGENFVNMSIFFSNFQYHILHCEVLNEWTLEGKRERKMHKNKYFLLLLAIYIIYLFYHVFLFTMFFFIFVVA